MHLLQTPERFANIRGSVAVAEFGWLIGEQLPFLHSLIRRHKVVLDRLVWMWKQQPLCAPSVSTVLYYLPELHFIYRNHEGSII